MTRLTENGVTIDALSNVLKKRKKRKSNQDPVEKRKTKVNDERERREDINEGFDLLYELLPTTYYKRKASKAELLKKSGYNTSIEVQDSKRTICTDRAQDPTSNPKKQKAHQREYVTYVSTTSSDKTGLTGESTSMMLHR
ncbi:18179_t:CDS:2 [Dentiscutata erythropus]|uniref:18179_t:CDS:1 n=1 Tax=Dentiscutata erythropus TaxID=1348616 RepID=A0A9N9GM11_9GLOM|nr:18179_t:CDS:2 [Dentiscutata erythropus]